MNDSGDPIISSQKEFVLDASVAMKWFVPEVHSSEAFRFLAADFSFHVPAFFYAEMVNTIWKKVGQRHQLSESEGRRILDEFDFLPVEVHHDSLESFAFDMILQRFTFGRPT